MRRDIFLTVGLLSFSGLASAQQPLYPSNPTKIAGVRPAGPDGQQWINYQPQPMPMPPSPTAPKGAAAPMNPMGMPSATQPGGPIPSASSTPLGQPNPLGNPPTVTVQPGTAPGTVIYDSGAMGGMPMGGNPGMPGTLNGPLTYHQDVPFGVCDPAAGAYAGPVGHPGLLAGHHHLSRFVQPGKWYGSAEYLMWYVSGNRLPPLLTTSLPVDNGFLGAPSTQTLFGNSDFSANQRNGGRFNLGYWFGCDQRLGIDATYYFLGSRNDSFSISSNGDPLLARPFTNANTGTQFSQIIAYPRQSSGTFTFNQDSSLWGGDINFRRFLSGNACRRFDTVLGFKYMNLEESLSIREDVNRLQGGFPGISPTIGSAIVTDSFATTNHFYGGQLGLLSELRRGRWYLDGRMLVGLGVMHQTLSINGSQTVSTANSVTTVPGGLLALPGANIGNYSQNKFAVVPEFGINVGYHLTPNCRLYVGYTFLYASSVLRPGDQIDTNIDVTRIPNFPTQATRLNTVRPAPNLNTTDFTAQGIQFGVQFKW